MSRAFIFFGKSGSGKGTQAELLKTFLEEKGKKVIYIETGKLARQFVGDNPENFTAGRVKETMESGKLLPAFVPVWLWSNALVDFYTGAEDVILDGLARRFEESELLERALLFLGLKPIYLFEIDISDEEAEKRLLERARYDDNKDDIKERLGWYVTQTKPALEYFEQSRNTNFHKIDGERAIDVIQADIRSLISSDDAS